MAQKVDALRAILSAQPVIPVVAVESAASAVALARALAAGGLRAIEITLRTPAALDAIAAVANDVPEAICGAGTILTPAQFEAAEDAGAQFIVSPGATVEVLDAAKAGDAPLLPGAATPSELMAMIEEGYEVLKFFPAEQLGGVAYLKALAPVFQSLKFCPTGGVSPANVKQYLGLPNVICVGGSWVAPKDLLDAGDYAGITALAADAFALRNA
ncbi:bifunctional 4-hydroxy-2-oxoglutarate aldolase/2-dehydro-3-deoxy-phosphogluconate aldolase [Aureimonas fodinaquatilis]|uniref:2-dehydro-3-deoxy-phosphogluconate aldolase n=1 Tax=Aureimonas fodinaquatilis TaxID=2565783 RepID=A0A5B0DZ90_9HYPH|nr:bifunctional 4-hydroxy-2-oxoglutarate aldolase/2-dehydro-3-deoxy-phosphogluconate aldolase [Aureimonas fodinaquatilis]KAA0972114.1 bifunctional 4-hydroxy-2-oxoglutarate aldolase/2-dehydro-3-deoxy-phosphogluconate aldolase [Aureimonas fodinaquatilis]